MNTKQRRKKKGICVGWVEEPNFQNPNRRKKSIRYNMLIDVLRLRKQKKTKDEIHNFGCDKYCFDKNNPWENRYLTYCDEKGI